MLAVAASKAGGKNLPVSFLQADAEDLPLPSESYDLVLAITTLCLASQPAAVLREAFRLLRADGRLVIGELNRNSYWAWIRRTKALFTKSTYRRARFFSRPALEGMLDQAGFKPAEIRSLLYFPPVNSTFILNHGVWFEEKGRRLLPGGGAFLALKVDKQT